MENNPEESLLQMHVDYEGGQILRETVRWSRFLSVAGIIGLALCLLVVAFAGSALLAALSRVAPGIDALGGIAGAIVLTAVLIVAAIFGFLVYMLYRFSVLTRRGIDHQDQAAFVEGMRCLKIYFVGSGILALLSLLSNLFSLTKLF
ncbi:MAG TPA: hypothetical protein VKU83_11960 [Puia sp.]|nr:hypothetical protein [Puia sp.]